MVGGDEETLQRARRILSTFGKRIEHLGPVGTGHAMKAVNNALLAVNILAVGERLAAVVKAWRRMRGSRWAFWTRWGSRGPCWSRPGGLLSTARAELGDDADYLEAIRLIERQAGIEIRG